MKITAYNRHDVGSPAQECSCAVKGIPMTNAIPGKRTRFSALILILPIVLSALLFSQPTPPAAAPALPADIPATAERYSFVMMGNLAGHPAVWTAPDGPP